MRRAIAALLALSCIADELAAQTGPVLVEVRLTVTAASGRDVFVDKGRQAGLEPGDEITLYPPGGRSTLARVQSVSRSNARARLLGTVFRIPPGTAGAVRVPKSRLSTPVKDPDTPPRVIPTHPPWQQPLGEDDPDRPLLAPVSGRLPSERPMRLHGRTWTNFTTSWNRGPVDHQSSLGNMGTELQASNPFGAGGEMHFRGDVSHRQWESSGLPSDSTTRARLDRLSYRLGHATGAAHRFQIGRFLQTMFPELGLVDGLEADTQLSTRQRVGFSLGGFPEPFTSQATGDELQAALFWRLEPDADDRFDLGLAYQKSWHEGSPDRDLLLVNSSYRPIDDLRLYSSLWVDYYTGSEQVQSSGFELTEALLNGSYRMSPGGGVGLTVSHIRWPDLKRKEFRAASAARILEDRVFRITGNSWHELTEQIGTTALVTYWEDQDTHGTSADFGCSLRGAFIENSSIDVHVFRNEGAFDASLGARLMLSRFGGGWSYHVGYEISRYERDNPTIAGSGREKLHAVMAGLQATLTDSTDLSFNLDYRFGDELDAFTVGAFFQTHY